MNITNCILRPVLRCTGLTVLWIAISASAQVLPSNAHRSGGVLRQMEEAEQIGTTPVVATPQSLPSTALTPLTFTFGTMDFPGAPGSVATGINNKSQTVGAYGPITSGVYPWRGFRLTGSSFAKISFPGAIQTVAYGISKAGAIVGWYYLSDGSQHGFLLVGKNFTTLDYPGATSTGAASINDSGQIVGFCTTPPM